VLPLHGSNVASGDPIKGAVDVILSAAELRIYLVISSSKM